MTDELRNRLASAIDDSAAPVTLAEAMSRGRQQARKRATVAVCATVVAVAVSGVAIASAATQNASRPAHVFVGDSPDSSSTAVSTPKYQASETLIILAPVTDGDGGARALLPVVPTRNALVAAMMSEDTARAVAEAGGVAQFSVAGRAEAPTLIEVVTTSMQAQNANRTLTIVDSVIDQKLLAMETAAGARPQDMLTSALIVRRDA